MSQKNPKIKDYFQIVLLPSCFVGHPVPSQTTVRQNTSSNRSSVIKQLQMGVLVFYFVCSSFVIDQFFWSFKNLIFFLSQNDCSFSIYYYQVLAINVYIIANFGAKWNWESDQFIKSGNMKRSWEHLMIWGGLKRWLKVGWIWIRWVYTLL